MISFLVLLPYLITCAVISVLDWEYEDFSSPVSICWFTDYLVPLDTFSLYHTESNHGVLFKVYSKISQKWVLFSTKTFREVDDDVPCTATLLSPASTDLKFLAMQNFLIFSDMPTVYAHPTLFTPSALSLIPPMIYKTLTPSEVMILSRMTSLSDVINIYTELEIESYLWPNIFDRTGRCILQPSKKVTLIESPNLELRRLTPLSMKLAWDVLVPHLDLDLLLVSMTQELWLLIISFASQHEKVSAYSIKTRWRPVDLLYEIGVTFGQFYSDYSLDKLNSIIAHFCDKHMLKLSFTQRAFELLEMDADANFKLFCQRILKKYWTRYVPIQDITAVIIDDYVAARTLVGRDWLQGVQDPLYLAFTRQAVAVIPDSEALAVARLWKFEEFRDILLTRVALNNDSLTLSDDGAIQVVACIEDMIAVPRLRAEDVFYPVLMYLERNLDYALPEELLMDLIRKVARDDDLHETHLILHLILIHQSALFEDIMEIPDYIARLILADITLEIPEYYTKAIPNILAMLFKSKNPFAYMRFWTEDCFCAPPVEFFVRHFCVASKREDSPHDSLVRLTNIDLSHGRLMAMFNWERPYLKSTDELLRFQWWLARRSIYQYTAFDMVHEDLIKYSNGGSLDLLLSSFCEYFGLAECTWIMAFAYAVTDPLLSVNLLTILNFYELLDLPEELFVDVELVSYLLFSLDVPTISPYLRHRIVESGLFALHKGEAETWLSSSSELLPELVRLDILGYHEIILMHKLYKVDWRVLAGILGVEHQLLEQMIQMQEYSRKIEFFRDILPYYSGLPLPYLAKVFKLQNEDEVATRRYLDRYTIVDY